MKRIFLLALILFLFLPGCSVSADTSGPRTTGTGANDNTVGTDAWTNPGNITADDGSVASCSLTGGTDSNRLKATNFGFTIPGNATILGIESVIQRRQQTGSSIQDVFQGVQILKAGNTAGTGKNQAGTWSTTMTDISYGGAADLWGTTWTPAELNNSGFGVSLRVTDSIATVAEVDVITITVTFTVPFIPRRTVYWGSNRLIDFGVDEKLLYFRSEGVYKMRLSRKGLSNPKIGRFSHEKTIAPSLCAFLAFNSLTGSEIRSRYLYSG